MARKVLAQGSSVTNVSMAAGSSLKSSRMQINTRNTSGDVSSAIEQSLTLEAGEEDLQETRVRLLFGPSFLGYNTQKVFQHGRVSRAVCNRGCKNSSAIESEGTCS